MSVILDQITIGELKILVLDQSPAQGSGLEGSVGSLAIVQGQSGIYQKVGVLDTEWELTSVDTNQLMAELAALEGRIDTLEVDPVTKSYVDSADSTLQTNINNEASARQSADTTLQNNINAEATARQNADTALDVRLDVLEADPVTKTYVDNVKSTLESADTVLQGDLATEVSARQAAVSAEEAARIAADALLGTRIDNILNNTDPAALDSLAEVVAAFQAADSNLNNAISSLSTGASSGLGTEVADRQAADALLQSQIDTEVSARTNADSDLQSQINSEISARQSADSSLQSSLNSEISARQTEDSTFVKLDGSRQMSGDLNMGSNDVKNILTLEGPAAQQAQSVTILYNSVSGGLSFPLSGSNYANIAFQANNSGDLENIAVQFWYEEWTNGAVSFTVREGSVAGSGNILGSCNYTLMGIGSNFWGMPVEEQVHFKDLGGTASLVAGQWYNITIHAPGVPISLAYSSDTSGSVDFYQSFDAETTYQDAGTIGLGLWGSQGVTGNANVIDLHTAGEIGFGSAKLVGIAAGSASTDAVNKGQLDAVQSSLQSNVDAEQSARIAADQDLQNQIDALDQGSASGLAQEILDRQAADSALDARLDVLEADPVTKTYVDTADNALDSRLDIIEGPNTQAGSIAKALKDANDYTDTEIAALVNSAPAVLDTLKELADALGDDPNFATTVAGQIGDIQNELDATQAGAGLEVSGAYAAPMASNYLSLATSLKDADNKLDAQVKVVADGLAQEILDRAADVNAEETARIAADNALDARLDIVEGPDTQAGSIAKALKDAKDYTDAEVLSEENARIAEDLTFVKLDGSRAMSGDLGMDGNNIKDVNEFGMLSNNVAYNMKGSSTSTVSAVNAVVATFAPAANSVELVKIMVTGFDSASNDSVSYEKTVRVKNNGGTLSLGTIQSDYTSEDPSLSQANCTFIVNASDIDVRVTGVSGKTITWKCMLHRIR